MSKYKSGDIVYYPHPIRAHLGFWGNTHQPDSALNYPIFVGAYSLMKLIIIKENEYDTYDCKDTLTGYYFQGVSALKEHLLFSNIDDYIEYCGRVND